MATRSKAGSSDVVGAVDRLSVLPDGIIHTVLSFLPAPEVMRTCVLSHRWRSLWRLAPHISIDQQDFGISLIESLVGHVDDALEVKWARFEDFATNQLLFHDNTSSLGVFQLSSRVNNHRHVDRWIRRGIEYRPSVLIIQILNNYAFKLPPVVGKNFENLKMLHLCCVDLGSHFAGLLCSACPVMEDLKLAYCEFYGNSSQVITSRTLKKLELESCVNYTGYPLVITVPCLAYLCLCYGNSEAGISLCKMDSLVRAKIDVTGYDGTLSRQTVCELLCSLYNVTSLELDGFGVEEMLIEKSDKVPIFHNMRTLEFHICFLDKYELYDKLESLGSFLQSAPCLEKLILNYCMFHSSSDSEWEVERKIITLHREEVKTFQFQQLKLIEVVCDHDHDHQLIELVWHLGRRLLDASIKLQKH